MSRKAIILYSYIFIYDLLLDICLERSANIFVNGIIVYLNIKQLNFQSI